MTTTNVEPLPRLQFSKVRRRRVFEEICDQIRRKLARGEFRPGDKLPTERELAAEFSVGRPAVREALRTLHYHGFSARAVDDVGVAGLWRLMDRLDELRTMSVLIVAAGMEGALVSVVGGLLPGAVIALPTSVGYGVSAHGRVALQSALASCAPGVLAVNIDNGYGAACAAIRILNSHRNAS